MIEAGRQLLHYRLVEKIGEGGMGVVWKAVDTTLDRQVAIKILPDAFSGDPERLVRFEREAKLLASLSHPNIAVIYGSHEANTPAGTVRFIAMEYVAGEDLAQRIARGPLPLDEAIETARKIAQGISAAHDNGTIHRDLKPANVRITPEGEVKVLDFGLARAAEQPSGADPSASPTLTSAGTAVGVLLGTAAYMSPEQARGRAVDRRVDVWAFGCLLYECLTGRRAFPGETISDHLAAILKSEPDWAALPASTPSSIRRLLRRCLIKDPAYRLRDMGDAALELTESDTDETVQEGIGKPAPIAGSRGRIAAAGIVAGLVIGVAIGYGLPRDPAEDSRSTGTEQVTTAGIVELPEAAAIAFGIAPIGYDSPMLTLSHDGRFLVYVGRDGAGSRLYRHDLSSFGPPEPIGGTEGALHAFFSPKESSVGFLTNDKLKRVDLSGDRLQVLGDVRSATRAIWGDDGAIYVGDSQATILLRFPEAGGAAKPIGELPYHGLSDILPGGTGALFHDRRTTIRCDYGQVLLYDFATGTSTPLLENAYDARVWGDRIVFIRGSELFAAEFDLDRGEVVGEPEILVRDVAVDSIFGQAQVALSSTGTLAYLPGTDRSMGKIAWVDRDGNRGLLPVEPRVYGTLDLDPADRRLAVHVADVRDYVWVYDLERQEGRVVPTENSAGWPIWNSAGDSVTYTEMGETYKLVQQRVDARETPRLIMESPTLATPGSWSPDDSLLAAGFQGVTVFEGDGRPVEEIVGFMPEFSPDGGWLAHCSEQAGVYETVVRSWPGGERVYSVQTDGGIEPVWSPSGELFYRLGDRWYVVETTTSGTFSWTPPRIAFEIAFLDTPGQSYDVTSDGQRMYTIVQAQADIDDRIHVVSRPTSSR